MIKIDKIFKLVKQIKIEQNIQKQNTDSLEIYLNEKKEYIYVSIKHLRLDLGMEIIHESLNSSFVQNFQVENTE